MDVGVCELRAADLAKTPSGVRALDALHDSAAQRVGGSGMPFVTYDVRRAQAARALGLTVLGS